MSESILQRAQSYVEIYSEFGLQELIRMTTENITNAQQEIVEVKAGRLYNPLMKEGACKELENRIEYENNDLIVFQAALELKRKATL